MANLRGRVEGSVVEVIVDHDAGTLGYRINGGPCLEALPLRDGDKGYVEGRPTTFPRGVALRPYCSAYYPGDSMRFVAAYL